MTTATAIIPARFESVRFPGKVLADETGKPLIQHVYERVREAKLIHDIVVATDDERVRDAVLAFGGQVVMTRRDHPNGTSRIAEAVADRHDDPVVNVQGDEPEIEPGLIDLAVQALVDDEACVASTVAAPFEAGEDPSDPNIVKVVIDQAGRALLFSRLPIPFDRDGTGQALARPLKHVGLYAYRRAFLQTYVGLPTTPLEQSERLEQLRILEHGFSMAVAIGEARFHGIDTPDQYAQFVRRYRESTGS